MELKHGVSSKYFPWDDRHFLGYWTEGLALQCLVLVLSVTPLPSIQLLPHPLQHMVCSIYHHMYVNALTYTYVRTMIPKCKIE